MREIKFRAKYIKTEEWVYGFYTLLNGKAEILAKCMNPPDEDPMWKTHFIGYDVIPESVGQYTGLHDKNNKEIYEGDILRLTWHDNYDCANYEYTGKVFFREDTCMFLVSNGKSTDYDWWHEEKEVIGNIYENPELLEREV